MQVERLDSFYFFRVDDCWIVDATKVPVACCLLAVYLAAVLCYFVLSRDDWRRNTTRRIALTTRATPTATPKFSL